MPPLHTACNGGILFFWWQNGGKIAL